MFLFYYNYVGNDVILITLDKNIALTYAENKLNIIHLWLK